MSELKVPFNIKDKEAALTIACTWGEGEDITIAFKNFPFVLYEEPDKSTYRHGLSYNGSFQLTKGMASELISHLQNAINQVDFLEQSYKEDMETYDKKEMRENAGNEQKIYCIDIDGVLTVPFNFKGISSDEYGEAYKIQQPNMEIINKVNVLYDNQHIIILHTARWHQDFDITEQWLNEHGVKYHHLVVGKPYADFYVDDKNVMINNFLEEH